MAVLTLPHPPLRSALVADSVPLGALVGALIAPALDVLGLAQPRAALPDLALMVCLAAGLVLSAVWLRGPRTPWLLLAGLALLTSGLLRLATGDNAAMLLSLGAVIALGAGGAFAPRVPVAPTLSAFGDPEVTALSSRPAAPPAARRAA